MPSPNSLMQPGADSRSHTKPLHQSVAGSVGQMTGATLSPQQMVPPKTQSPAQSVDEKPGFDLDLEDIVNRERGKWGNEKSKSFLGKLKEKLMKKFPGQEVKND